MREIALRYQVSKGTVEKALAWLTQQGRVHGEIGRGTFIVRNAPGLASALSRVVVFAPDYGRRAGHYLQSITQGLGEFALKRRIETVLLFLDPAAARRRIALERDRLLAPGTGAVLLHAGGELDELLREPGDGRLPGGAPGEPALPR